MSTDSQREQILDHLMKGRSITHLEAEDLFGCARLGARIWELRQPKWGSHPIDKNMVKVRSGKHVASYFYNFSVKPGVLQKERQGVEQTVAAFAMNDSGEPKHPLYVGYDAPLMELRA